jgi:hypothetical protein
MNSRSTSAEDDWHLRNRTAEYNEPPGAEEAKEIRAQDNETEGAAQHAEMIRTLGTEQQSIMNSRRKSSRAEDNETEGPAEQRMFGTLGTEQQSLINSKNTSAEDNGT